MLTPIQKAEKLIAAGRTEEALKVLIKGASGKYKRSFLKLSNRLKKLERQNISGTIDDRVYDAKINKITSDLVLTTQSYEAHLNGETVGTSPDTIKWAIVGIVVFIIGFWGVRYWFNSVKPPPLTEEVIKLNKTDDKCSEQKNVIYIAKSELLDINKEFVSDNILFSTKLRAKVEDEVSSSYSVVGLVPEQNYRNRKSVEKLFESDTCEYKGLFVNSNYFPDRKICDVYIDVVRLKLPNPQLIGKKRIIIDNPPNIQFEINLDASLVSDIILAIGHLYENNPKKTIEKLTRFEANVDLEKQKKLKAFVMLSKCNAYLMIGNKAQAIREFNQVKTLGYYSEITEAYEAFLVNSGPGAVLNRKVLVEGEIVDKGGSVYPYITMKDGKQWIAKNLNIEVASSWCYDNDPKNCEKYGRLYDWEAAKEACKQLGDGWRLPTDEEWTKMVDQYGGAFLGNAEGSTAYLKLADEGSSEFSALLGGSRNADGSFLNLGAYGGYWSATELGGGFAYYYDFNGGDERLRRGRIGQEVGLSVRCLQN